MSNFVIGTVFGIVVATVGFTSMARVLDTAVDSVKKTATEQVSKH
jgi:hypothetical protein